MVEEEPGEAWFITYIDRTSGNAKIVQKEKKAKIERSEEERERRTLEQMVEQAKLTLPPQEQESKAEQVRVD